MPEVLTQCGELPEVLTQCGECNEVIPNMCNMHKLRVAPHRCPQPKPDILINSLSLNVCNKLPLFQVILVSCF